MRVVFLDRASLRVRKPSCASDYVEYEKTSVEEIVARLKGARRRGFDVLTVEPPPAEHLLLNLHRPNFILTPHVAEASNDAMQTLADQLVDNIDAWASGQPRHLVT